MTRYKFYLLSFDLIALGAVLVWAGVVLAQGNTAIERGPMTVTDPVQTPQFLPLLQVPWPWAYVREAENADEFSVGQTVIRSNACQDLVHGQFGTVGLPPFPARDGYVKYEGVEISQIGFVYIRVRYSKHSPAIVPVEVFLDGESTPRISFVPDDQGDWDTFTWTPDLSLGEVTAGTHTLKFYTNGQQYGVIDLDIFQLSVSSTTELPQC